VTTYLAIAAWTIIGALYLRREWRDMRSVALHPDLVARVARYSEREGGR